MRYPDRTVSSPIKPEVTAFYEPRTSSIQYVVADPLTRACAIIDPVLDFDPASGSVATHSADQLLAFVAAEGLQVAWILDTHLHADHLSAAAYLAQRTGACTGVGAGVPRMQSLWKRIYGLDDLAADGSHWDKLFADRERFAIGALEARAIFSPGHTCASATYVIGDAAFIHDTLFMPDSGTARADFPGGDAHELWRSIQAILALPDSTRLFVGHDYQPGGRAPCWETTVAEQKRANIHLVKTDEATFVAMRRNRDRGLPMPKLLLMALQVNIRGGRLPAAEADGRRYLRIPIDAFPDASW